MLENYGLNFRRNLVRRELSTNDEVLKCFQLTYKEIEKKLEANFRAIRAALKKGETISPAQLFERTRLQSVLTDLGFEIDKLSLELGKITTKAQKDSIIAAIAETNQIFKIGEVLDKNITGLDPGAMRELVGIAGNGEPLSKLFNSLKPPLIESIKNSLITGVASGASPEAIAREIKTALGTRAAHALTISRTETNRAYRESTRKIYDSNKEFILGYVWVSSRDLRTCPICWAMHGRIFPTSEKFATHPNCRCSLVGVLSEKDKFKRGADYFKKLPPGQQKEILGSARFDLYTQKKAKIEDFVGEKNTDFGSARYIRPLYEI